MTHLIYLIHDALKHIHITNVCSYGSIQIKHNNGNSFCCQYIHVRRIFSCYGCVTLV